MNENGPSLRILQESPHGALAISMQACGIKYMRARGNTFGQMDASTRANGRVLASRPSGSLKRIHKFTVHYHVLQRERKKGMACTPGQMGASTSAPGRADSGTGVARW